MFLHFQNFFRIKIEKKNRDQGNNFISDAKYATLTKTTVFQEPVD